MEERAFKSGFINIIGNPNVGKSTLANALVGENLSIVTAKAQTTRHRIMGIVNGEDYQMVFSDTPGILKPSYKLQESMMEFVKGAFTDADIILYVTDTVENPEKNKDYVERLNKMECPVIVVINKIDLTNQQKLERLVEEWHKLKVAINLGRRQRDLDNAKAEADKFILDAKKQQSEILREAARMKAQIIEDAKEAATLEAKKVMDAAQLSIAQERKEAELQFRNEVSAFAIQIAEKLLRERMANDKAQSQLVDKLLNELETQN